jgi:choline dehydrogenase
VAGAVRLGRGDGPQPHAAERRIHWPRGRALGGSSSINGMVYVRGNRVDYDTWRDAYGCPGWGYAELLPYFRRAEDQQRGSSAYHGTGGPLRVEDPRYVHPLSRAWVAAATAAGLPANDDFNAATQDGVGFYQATQRDGRRWSAADGYLRPALGRDHLTVETGALATRVLIEGGRAVGVRYLRLGAEREAARGVRWSCAAGRSVARNCCCCRASGTPSSSARTASSRSWTPPRWASACRTTLSAS